MAAAEANHPRAAPRIQGPRRTVASIHRYPDAESTVDYLLARGIPADRVAIVASDLRVVEEVTARARYGAAMANGAAAGAAIGALFGFVGGMLRWIDPLVAGLTLALYGLVLGGVLGAVAGAVIRLFTRGDFVSVGRLDAGRYDVMVDEGHAANAVELLERRPGDRSRRTDSSDGEPSSPPESL